MNEELTILLITAASIGFFHTLLGPDHYLPFVAISKARDWSQTKTLLLTILCGFGHVFSSIILGLIGVALGTAVTKLEFIESIRGELAAWTLIAFGLVYLIWGLRRAYKNKHQHHHHNDKKSLTPWVLFIVFVLGPCEPLIPILMYPAAKSSLSGMILVAGVFSIVTIATMTLIVYLLIGGFKLLKFPSLERYSHALAGFVILLCGVAIRFGL
ncbi:MAG: hypothetical protein DRP51_03620 [Candidatus Zixiibacteriota bacterium]|nr:MAG: hypothetical protein DRP51_03620 [candidate division Zixibacteria bacterium]HHI02108.1 hypothetical protein [candidate division Zixibacteria bacterium]